MKKTMVFLSLLLTLTLLVGCAPVELEFYSLIKEVSSLEATRTEGEIEVEIGGSALTMATMMVPEAAALIDYAEGLVIRYSGEQSLEDNSMYMDFEFADKDNTDFRPLTSIIMEDDVLYIRTKEMVEVLVETMMPLDEMMALEIQESLGDFDYIKMDMAPMMEEVYGVQSPKELLESYFSILDFVTEVFHGLDTNTVTKEGNKYTYEIGVDNFLDVLEVTLMYVLENNEEVIASLKHMIGNMESTAFENYLTTFNITKEEIQEVLLEIGYGIQEEEEEIVEAFQSFRVDMEETGFLEMFEGSKVLYSLEKLRDNVYEAETELMVKADVDGMTLHFMVKETATVTEIKRDEMEIKQPTGAIMDVSDLLLGALHYEEGIQTVIVNVDSGEYTTISYTDVLFDEVNVVVRDGRSYLPLRRIGEDLGEVVGWDNQTHTPYVHRGDTIIEMGGLLVDGTAYVMVRDFEKLGYDVEWMESTRDAFISKVQ